MSHRDITGRDGYVTAKALYTAIKHAETLPEDQVPWSDVQDMKAILAVCFPGMRDVLVMGDSNPPDLTDGKAAEIITFPA